MAAPSAKSSDTSLRGMAYEIRNILSGGITSDDTTISLRQIERSIKDIFASTMKEEDDIKERKGEKLDAQRVLPFPCIDLVENTDFFCKCTGAGGKFKKAVIPKMIQNRGLPYIPYFGTTDMLTPFDPRRDLADLNSKYGYLNVPSYFVAGNTAYVALPEDFVLVCQITLLGIPVDPLATSGPCFDVWSQDWNIPGHMRSIVKQRTIEFLGNPLATTTQTRDVRNNAQSGNQFATIES